MSLRLMQRTMGGFFERCRETNHKVKTGFGKGGGSGRRVGIEIAKSDIDRLRENHGVIDLS